jgi:hypothetical protein
MTERERTHIEERVADDIARQLIDRLPRSSDERERLIESAARFAPLMSWDSVIEDELLPLLEKIVAMSSSPTPSHALH